MNSSIPKVAIARNLSATGSRHSTTAHRSLEELEPLRQLWQNLTHSEASPFQSFSWNRAWYRHFQNQFNEIIVFVNSKATAIFPLYRRGSSLRLAGDLSCDFQDAIALDLDEVTPAFAELASWAAERGLTLDFRKLSTRGFLYNAVTNFAPSPAFFPQEERFVGPCPWFPIKETPELTLAHLPRKLRAELRRQIRRIGSDFPQTEFRCFTPGDLESEHLEEMFSFHIENFRFSGSNPLNNPSLRNLLFEVAGDPDVGLCIARLGNDDTTMAMDITFLRGSRFYGYLTAYNSKLARYSPGNCILHSRLAHLIEAGISTFDFLCGPETYKYRFAQDQYQVRSIRLIPRNFSGLFQYASVRAHHSFRDTAKAVLKKSPNFLKRRRRSR